MRHAAARTILLLLRHVKKLEQREAVVQRFIDGKAALLASVHSLPK